MAGMLEKIRDERIQKIKKLRDMGIEPYPSDVTRTHKCQEIVDQYDTLEGTQVSITGRIMSWRDLGSLIFANLKDFSGSVQVIIRDEAKETHTDLISLLDVGDFLEVTGDVMKSKTGEISVSATNIRIISKALRPLPEKWSGLKDEDQRFRKRYLDFATNDDSRNKIYKRTQVLEFIRRFLWEKGFMEIENPSLELTAAGAEAKPFITHINVYDMDVYLRICAGELWQKMSTIGGFEKVFEIARAYRNEGVDAEHNPEFTMLEFYWAYANLSENIDLQEELFKRLVKEITGSEIFEYDGKTIDLSKDIPRTPYNDLFIQHADIDLNKYTDLKELQELARSKGADIDDDMGWYSTVDGIFKHLVRPNIYDPVFIIDYPAYITPLAKKIDGNDRYVHMAQLVIHGMEMTRAYGELNDPIYQKEAFDMQSAGKEAGDENTWTADDEYVEAMEYGMPPQSGTGIGIDRLVKVLTDSKSLRDVIAYPIMKPLNTTGAKKESKVTTPTGTQDLSQKFVVVLNKEVEGWQMTNTLGHITAYLGSKIQGNIASRDVFNTADGDSLPADSQYPVITLAAKPGQMYNFLQKVEESGLIYLAYTQEMIDHNNDDDLANDLEAKKKENLNYLGIGIFGDATAVDALTKKFSLWK